jgi:hypothetical protein
VKGQQLLSRIADLPTKPGGVFDPILAGKVREGRLQFIQLYRKTFETLHCQLGFRKVALSKGTFSLGSNEYDLHCPQTPAERAAALQARSKAVAGLQSDFQREGLPITARLEGPNEDRLAFSYDLFKMKADRDTFFSERQVVS